MGSGDGAEEKKKGRGTEGRDIGSEQLALLTVTDFKTPLSKEVRSTSSHRLIGRPSVG